MISKKITVLLLSLLSFTAVNAQSITDVTINEILVKNSNSYVDEYGQRVGWIELKNNGYSKINIAGCRLVVEKGGESISYKIPKNDPRTTMAPQDYLLFFAEGSGSKGTFYTNFTLDNATRVALYDASGKNIVSDITINPSACKADISQGYVYVDGKDEKVWQQLLATTPAATNDLVEKAPRAELFEAQDPHGFAMAITAMSVVFLALIMLFLVFKRVGYILVAMAAKKDKSKTAPTTTKKPSERMKEEIHGEVVAAIAIAIRQYEEDLHDIESTVMTINRVAKVYSPWSSKIYGVTRQPNK